ncbi:retrovirus-related pol polyprotein from transposon TNT 1-94 [Tanacetum coccineum]|uniref:Retrovirus-related pol polyprotein from transposon TNT 1-94 n=1 Tax=Tanacetum coccineum TaxID=301880 RepID=A0ABQ4WQA3_9ASTR
MVKCKHDRTKKCQRGYENCFPAWFVERRRVRVSTEGFIEADHPLYVYKLKKALYGLKQAPRAWYDELSKFLLQNSFSKGTIDPTLFIRCFDDDILVVQVYVDDIIFVNQSPCGIFINQSNYVLEILKKYGMETCDPVGTPIEIKDKLDLGSANQKHLKEVQRIFCYLWRTVNMGLWYTRDSNFELTGFSDADYAGCRDTFKSTSGGTQFLGKKLVSWSSKKQDYTSLPTAKAEYIPIYCDSKSAIAISCNPVQHSRTKYIAVRYHFIKEHVEKGMIELYFVKTDYQLANLFTKSFQVDRFNYLVRHLDTVIADSEDSTVTYTEVSSPFEDGSDIGSPGVDGPPIMPEDPYAYIMVAYQVPPLPDYIPGPEVPPSPNYILGPEEPQSPSLLDFIPEPMYPEYIPQEDEILPAEEQPLLAAASPTADPPGYVPESDPEEEPEEDDEDPEEDPSDYPTDRDDDDDEDEDEDKEVEEEHPAPADSVPPVHRMTARISIRDEPSISLPPMEEVERLLALTTPPPSPLTPLSSPLPHIPSPPFPASHCSPIRLLGLSACYDPLLSSDHRTDRPEITLPPRKRLGIDLGPRYELGESSAAAATRPIGGRRTDYGFVGTMDTEIRRRRAEEVGYGIRDVWVTELTAVQEQDTQDIYAVIEDTQDRQTQIYQSVGTLVDDSQYHYETARLLDQEALVSREAWGCSIEVSYMTRSEILALRSVVMGQQAVISQLQAADRKSQVVTLEMLQADYQRQVQLTKALELLKGLQTQMAEFQRQLGPAKGPAQPDAPGEAGSSS